MTHLRPWIFVAFTALTATACSNDGGTTPPTPDASTEADVEDGATDAGDTGPGTEDCVGCVVDGECFDGDENERCGTGGDACTDCGSDMRCSESGECVSDFSCADECDGCCDETGGCQAGDEDSFCGSGGLMCAACADGESCVDGVCKAPCGPANCGGCCDASGECVEGDADAACGTGGGACLDCAADGDACSEGVCISTDCRQTCDGCCDGDTCIEPVTDEQCGLAGSACVECGLGRTCGGGTRCSIDSQVSWQVTIVSGEIGGLNTELGPWDGFNGLPDPYVTIEFPIQQPASTTVLDNTLTPMWDEAVGDPAPAGQLFFDGLQLQVRDKDAAFDDEICDIDVDLEDSRHPAWNSELIESECPDAALGTIRWRMEPVP